MTYTVTAELTAAPLKTFSPADYPGGAKGALKAASIFARRYARDTGTCLLTGDGIPTRRYSKVYQRRSLVRPYRVQGTCGHWVFPDTEPGKCRECFSEQGQSEKQKTAVAAANRRRGASG